MSTIEIPLTQGLAALVDETDADRVRSVGKWFAQRSRNTFYAARTGGVLLHRVLCPTWPLVDHINGNGLDNRRANLRQATHAENMRNRAMHRNNTTGLRGVSLEPSRGQYRACIKVDGRTRHLGRFAEAEAAGRAYDAAAREFFGEFARLNFPNGGNR